MKNIFLFISIIILNVFQVNGQGNSITNETKFKTANEIFSKIYNDDVNESSSTSKLGYSRALITFLELYQLDTSNCNLAFKIGVCYLGSRRYHSKSIPYLKKASGSVSHECDENLFTEMKAPVIALKYLGNAFHLNYEFDNAIVAYKKCDALLIANNNFTKQLKDLISHKIEICYNAKDLVANPVKINIKNLGHSINSTFSEYSPVLTADQKTIFFTSRRPESTGSQKDADGNNMEDIYQSNKTKNGWSDAVNIGKPINTDWHEATVGVSPDGQTILIYKDDLGDGNIYSTSLKGEIWSTPVKLNENINSKFWEPSAFISADGSTLYFVSDKPGGYGGRDIYMSKKSNGDWEKAVNLGPNINTAHDEDSPFIHHDGLVLSFSSNGHKTMGGFDIFNSVLIDGNWSLATNAGYPINTPDDDIFYMVSPDGLTAYFSSFRKEGNGEKDIYMATFLEKKEKPLTLMIGTVTDHKGKALDNVEIVVTDNSTEELIGVFRPNEKTGKYVFILTPGRNYNITYQATDHLFYSENREISLETNYYEIYKPIMLDSIKVGSKITLNNIFFDFDRATLRSLSNIEIRNLVSIMKKYPKMKVEIEGHTDSKGDENYNQNLAKSRAQAVIASLIAQGISAARMIAKGYGETLPVVPNHKIDGSDDPEGRQLNRRVEFKITGLE